MTRILSFALAMVAVLLLWPARADAQRGGGRGGMRSGGAGARHSFNRTPSFTAPARPQYGGGGMRQYGGGMSPSAPAARPTPRPERPNFGGARPPVAPSTRPSNIGRERPSIGTTPRPPVQTTPRPAVQPSPRPPIAGPGPGRPPASAPGRPPGWGWGPNRPPVWTSRPGWNRHNAWINGYWHGRNQNWWTNTSAFFTGMAIGGVGAWGLNSAFYNWGYRPYVNPYVVVAQQPAAVAAAPVLDYSQPLPTSEPPAPETADPALQTFEAARAAFKGGDYDGALRMTDEALKTLPDDAAIHEFRALCLFALKRYDEAAAVLYAVLSAGPGWDWTTLIGLYPSVDVYTAQLRSLEQFRQANPTSAPARFVLGYHYLTQGHAKAALAEFQGVVQLQPADALSAQLVALLSNDREQPKAETVAPASPAEAPKGNLVGSWKASPEPGVTIELTLGDDRDFRWNVNQSGQSLPIQGEYVYDNGVLSLVRAENDAMVGRVTWKSDSEFVFQAMGGGPNDPGLTFTK